MNTDAAELADIEHDLADEANRPGIFTSEEIPAHVYHRMQALSSSMLQGFYKTPAHAKEWILHPRVGTESQEFGEAFHARVLEPHIYAARYVVAPKFDRRTKAGKEGWAEFEAAHKGATVLDANDRDVIEEMALSVERHPAAREILAAPGQNEVTVIWDQKVPGEDGEHSVVRCRARLDILRTLAGDTWVWDLKSTRDASERGFEREIATYRYYAQVAYYLTGLDAHHPAPRRAGFIAVEKERPYATNVMELDSMDLDQGRQEMLAHLRTYVRCMATGKFEAYGDGVGYVGLPDWARRA